MKKFLKWTGITLLVVVALYFIIALFAPSHYLVERSRSMTSPVSVVYNEISVLKNWSHWSPWERMDSTAKYTYEGTDGAVGSVMRWKGEKTGEGSVEITELVPNEKVGYKLSFVDMNSVSTGAFTLSNSNDSTRVNWTNEGDIPFLFRTICLFKSMDDMMGPDFENGLKFMDEYAATVPVMPAIPDYVVAEIEFPASQYLGIHYDTLTSAIDSTLMGATYGELGAFCAEKKVEMVGAPVSVTWVWDEQAGRCEIAPAFPVAATYKHAKHARVESIQVPASKALCIDYYGRYENIWMAHVAMDTYMKEHNLKMNLCIEEYVTDPTTVPTYDSVLTKVYYILQ